MDNWALAGGVTKIDRLVLGTRITISESQGSAEKNVSTEEKNGNTELHYKTIQHQVIKNQ